MFGYDDDDGQVDGDTSGAVQFAPTLGAAGQPWLQSPLPPWHLWGGTVQLRVDSLEFANSTVGGDTQQLAKISYKRPDTWSFFFGARLLGGLPVDEDATVAVIFDVTTGTGRTSFQSGPQPLAVDPFDTLGFAKFVWLLPSGSVPIQQVSKYTTQVETPRLDDRTPQGDTTVRHIEWLPGQEINVSVRLIVLPIVEPVPFIYLAEASCYFAPRSHVRPDWAQDKMPPEVRFAGAEIGGK